MPQKNNDRSGDWNAHVRGAWVVLWLYEGHKLSNIEIARRTGLNLSGVNKMMQWLCLAFPIAKVDGKWKWHW